jgi:hypothetical protein
MDDMTMGDVEHLDNEAERYEGEAADLIGRNWDLLPADEVIAMSQRATACATLALSFRTAAATALQRISPS